MELKKLTDADMCNTALRKIYCYEKSVSHLTELCDRYGGIEERICQIIDDNVRQQGMFPLKGREISVCGSESLVQDDLSDTMVIITSDYHREAYEKLCGMKSLCKTLDTIYYFADRETEYENDYRERYKNRSLEELILFRSGPHASSYVHGMDFSDNARALFEYMLHHNYNKRYKLVWLVKDPNEFSDYQKIENVEFVSFDWSISEKQEERDRYYHALCLAKVVFFTDAYGFARNCRSDQVRVQLWHGCGFKTRVNFVRCEKRYEYTTVISDLYADIHADIYGLRKDQVLVTGYAKQDWLFHPEKEDLIKLKIPSARKYIFWLPTFRSTERKLEQLNEYVLEVETGLPIVNTRKQMEALNDFLSANDIVLIVKLHPFQNRDAVFCEGCSNIHLVENADLAELDIPINRLLGQADALISDYSSVAVDFMLLDKPIAFMLEDVEEYQKSRGFVFENIREWLPGKEIFTFEDVYDFIEEVANDHDTTESKRRILRGRMHKYCDDCNCRRILEQFNIEAD